MKKNLFILAVLAAVAFVATGCCKSGNATPAASVNASQPAAANSSGTGTQSADIYGG
jgi:hypothetical protein